MKFKNDEQNKMDRKVPTLRRQTTQTTNLTIKEKPPLILKLGTVFTHLFVSSTINKVINFQQITKKIKELLFFIPLSISLIHSQPGLHFSLYKFLFFSSVCDKSKKNTKSKAYLHLFSVFLLFRLIQMKNKEFSKHFIIIGIIYQQL